MLPQDSLLPQRKVCFLGGMKNVLAQKMLFFHGACLLLSGSHMVLPNGQLIYK